MKKTLSLLIIFLIAMIISGCENNKKENLRQGVYIKNGEQKNEIYGPIFTNYDACRIRALSKIVNTDDLSSCNKNCHDSLDDGTLVCEDVIRNKSFLPQSHTFDNYKE